MFIGSVPYARHQEKYMQCKASVTPPALQLGGRNRFVNRQWIDFPTGSSEVITRFHQIVLC